MRDESEVIAVAAQLKAKLLARNATLENMVSRKSKSDAGLIKRLHPEVYDTLERDIKALSELNIRDSIQYATFRWVIGVTDIIDHDDLQLET